MSDVSGKGRGGECPTGSPADGFVASGNTVVACHEELQREFIGNAGLYTLSYCHLAGKSTDLFDSIDAGTHVAVLETPCHLKGD